jgi:c-di-GMP-binding flagellar brake protein YcgR
MEDLGRKYTRGKLIMPALLKDTQSNTVIKAVILDISATGIRLVTNDKLMRITPEDVLMAETFDMEFDFFDINTAGIQGKIANIKKGLRHEYERQIGLEFTHIDKTIARDINRKVLSELS